MTTAELTKSAGSPHRSRLATVFGRQPLGIAFAAPYAIFLVAVFAYPLGLAVWMSFHDYFFTAPGASVPRPFVGFDNYADGPQRPGRSSVVPERRRLPGHQRAAHGGAVAAAGQRAQRRHPRPDLLPGRLLRALHQCQRRGRRGVAVPVLQGRHGQPAARQPGAGSVLAGQLHAGDAADRDLRHLEGARLLHPALPRRAPDGAQGALRVGLRRRRDPLAEDSGT